jgi:hypothetical protein
MLGAAEGRLRELHGNADAIWRERRRLVENMSALGRELQRIADTETARFEPTAQAAEGESTPAGEPAMGEEPEEPS